MGGLVEIAGIELSAIDALLYVWFALAALSTAYVVWDNFVNKNPEETVMSATTRTHPAEGGGGDLLGTGIGDSASTNRRRRR